MVKKSKKKSRGGGQGQRRPEPTGLELYVAAQEALELEDVDAARDLLRQAVKAEPANVELLDAYGALLAEAGPQEEAVRVLKCAVQLAPDQGHAKYMYLGQLLDGDEGVTLTRKGVDVLQRHVAELAAAESADPVELAEGRAQLCEALCALAEALMHIAVDAAEVCEEVSSLLEQARALQPRSPEPLLALASLRCETGHTEQALQHLRDSLKCWMKPQDPSDSEAEENEDEDQAGGGQGMEVDEEEGLPSYEFRCETAKLLIELDDTTEAAIQVLEGLMEENDAVPEVWHLLGLAYYGGGLYQEALETCEQGQKLAKKFKAGAELKQQFDELVSAITEAKAGCAPATIAEEEPEKIAEDS